MFFIDQYWNENGPIFFYTGNEGPITGFWDNSGFVFEAAEKFNALVIFGEHVSNRPLLFYVKLLHVVLLYSSVHVLYSLMPIQIRKVTKFY